MKKEFFYKTEECEYYRVADNEFWGWEGICKFYNFYKISSEGCKFDSKRIKDTILSILRAKNLDVVVEEVEGEILIREKYGSAKALIKEKEVYVAKDININPWKYVMKHSLPEK